RERDIAKQTHSFSLMLSAPTRVSTAGTAETLTALPQHPENSRYHHPRRNCLAQCGPRAMARKKPPQHHRKRRQAHSAQCSPQGIERCRFTAATVAIPPNLPFPLYLMFGDQRYPRRKDRRKRQKEPTDHRPPTPR